MTNKYHSIESLVKENQRLKRLEKKYETLRIKELHLRIINEFATSLIPQNTVDEIVWTIAKNTVAKLDYVDCVVYLKDETGTFLIQKAAHGPKNPIELDIKNPIRLKIGEGIVGAVAETGIPEIVHDTRLDNRYIIDDASRFSEIAIPIITDSNQVLGVIDSEHPEPNFFDDADLQILSTISNITAAKLMQAMAQDQLKRSNEALEQFAYIASHDLQEPLRMIGSYAQLLERKYQDSFDAQGKEFLSFMMEGAQRMSCLVRDLLNYSRTNKKIENQQTVDCQLVLERVLQDLHFSIKESNALIESDKLPIIRGQFSQIVQLFQNLIGNALKFQSDNIPHLQIRVKKEYAQYLFSFSDNGIGISEEYQEKIFQIFKRLHNRNEFEGTGIGLAICKKIVDSLGGKIWVRQNKPQGSIFYFTIPD